MSDKAFCPECEVRFAPSKCEVKKTREGVAFYCPNCEEQIQIVTWEELLDNGYLESAECES